MNRLSSVLLAASIAGSSLFFASRASADVPPMCSMFDMTTSCDQADVGKACSGGGTCASVSCGDAGGSSMMTLYKCVVCPTKIDDPNMVCKDFSSFDKPCGDGGKCAKNAPYCGGDFACVKSGGAGGGAGAGGSGGEGGSAGQQAGGSAGSGTAGSGTAGSGTAGSGTAGSGTAGNGTGGSGTAGNGAAGSGTAGSSAGAAASSGDGSSSSDDGGGCSVSPLGKRGAMAALVTLLGAAALLVDRRRRG